MVELTVNTFLKLQSFSKFQNFSCLTLQKTSQNPSSKEKIISEAFQKPCYQGIHMRWSRRWLKTAWGQKSSKKKKKKNMYILDYSLPKSNFLGLCLMKRMCPSRMPQKRFSQNWSGRMRRRQNKGVIFQHKALVLQLLADPKTKRDLCASVTHFYWWKQFTQFKGTGKQQSTPNSWAKFFYWN